MTEVLYTGPESWGDKAYPGDAGIDLPIVEEVILTPGEFADLPSGIKVAIPEGYYGRIVARSSALRKRRVRVYEGIIDAGFRGELFTYVENIGPSATKLSPGDRLAQMIIQPVLDLPLRQVPALPDSIRGVQGFGSSDNRTLDRMAASLARLQSNGHGATVLVADQDGPLISVGEAFGQRTVYMGGPIDHRSGEPWWQDGPHGWLDLVPADWRIYDPQSMNAHETDPSVIWNRNMDALLSADLAIFAFIDGPGSYGFGSPIEIYERCIQTNRKPTICYVEGHSPGVYLRKLWQDHGLILTDDWKDARRLLAEEFRRIR